MSYIYCFVTLFTEGCAHFLEHMVFMGSEKYPDENYYDSFITSHGGSCNAFTEGEYTTYHFDVSTKHFAEALDIFSHCFVHPLLAPGALSREIKAIESEFNIAKTSDSSRMTQLFCHCADPRHNLIRKFSWGNFKSLDVIPRSRNIDIRALLWDFYSLHYQPHNMKVVLISQHSIEDLEVMLMTSGFSLSWGLKDSKEPSLKATAGLQDSAVEESSMARKRRRGKKQDEEVDHAAVSASNNEKEVAIVKVDGKISQKRGGNQKRDRLLDTSPMVFLQSLDACLECCRDIAPITSNHMSLLTRIVPVKNTHQLSITWQLMPSHMTDYRRKVVGYISHLLGHEASGSLLSALKAHSLASDVSAGVDESDNFSENSMFSLFVITVTLTTHGLAHWMYVVDWVYAYLGMLRSSGPEKWVFDELQRTADIKFRKYGISIVLIYILVA